MSVKSHLTAIRRKVLSAPANWLLQQGFLNSGMAVLDYGCGRGDDVRLLEEEGLTASGYDPHYFPETSLSGEYDVVLCTYVLNVLNLDEQEEVLHILKGLNSSSVYITVRRDLDGPYTCSSRGTEQYLVQLDEQVLRETSRYCIYSL